VEITEEVDRTLRASEITSYGSDKLPAGPHIENSDAIIVVEGRADVLTLLKHGIKNAVGVQGTNIPKTVVELMKKKTTTVFVDGDRGGDLIIKELSQLGELDFIARAPNGKEVEELTKKEIFKALRNKVPAEQVVGGGSSKPEVKSAKGATVRKEQPAKTVISKKDEPFKPMTARKEQPAKSEDKSNGQTETFKKIFGDLSGTFKAFLLDEQSNIIKEVAVRDLASALKNSKEKVSIVIFDGVITQRLVEISSQKNVKYLIGAKIGNIVKKPAEIKLLSANDIGAA
jgi:DNA primase